MSFDAAPLLQPISAEQPAGQWLRSTDEGKVLWNTINDAYRAARDAEKQLMKPSDPDAPRVAKAEDLPTKIARSWETVLTQGEKALKTVSKDFTVAAWMVEALFRVDELEGLRDGLSMCRQLCTTFWGSLWPRVDDLDVEDGVHTTVSQFAGLSIALETPLNMLVITDSGKRVVDYLRATQVESLDAAAKQKALADGAPTLDSLVSEGARTSAEVHAARLKAIEEALKELNEIKEFLTNRCFVERPEGDKTWLVPNLIPFVELLERVRDAIECVRGAATGAAATDASQSTSPGGGGPMGGPTFSPVDVRSREAAYTQLLTIAEFLEKAEPHSPVPHMLRQAVRFGRMSLPELMVELLGKGEALNNVVLRTGVKIPEESTN